MKPRILVIAGLTLAVVIVAAAAAFNLMTGQPQATSPVADSTHSSSPSGIAVPSPHAKVSASATSAATTPGPSGSASTGSQPKPSANSKPSEAAAPVNPKAPAATPDPSRPLEVVPPAPSTAAGLPKSKTPAPLVTLPLPAAASANGALAAGFPSSVIETAPSSALKSSSVSPQEAILQVSLVAISPDEPQAIIAFYQKQFATLGLGAAEAPSNAGSSAMWFTRGSDKITVTATPHQGGGTEYNIFGVLHAES